MLNFEGEEEDAKIFCQENNITLSVSENLTVAGFAEARQKTFGDACRVWNAVDRSGRQRLHVFPGQAISQRWETDVRR